ncbi:unnamed protein product, partial [Staurois parvus]
MSVRLMERIWSGRSGISTVAVSEYRAGRSALQRDLMEMTADLWGGGERVPEFDRYPLLLPRSCSLTLPVPVSSHLLYCPQSLVIPVLSAVSGHLLYCPQSLVIS